MINKYKILIIAPAWVGDMVMSQTLFKLLKQRYGERLILDVFAGDWARDILQRMPEVNRVIVNPFAHGKLALLNRIKLGIALRREKYDQVFVLPNSLKSAITPLFSGIKRRTGFIGESRYILLNDIYRLNRHKLPLMIDRFCALDNHGNKPPNIPYPRLIVNKDNQQKLTKELNIDPNKTLIAFCPAAEFGPAKRWLPEHFANLANLLTKDGYQIIILGSNKDTEISKEIIKLANNQNIIDACGKTSLVYAVDLLALANYVITNDSGLMHVACAVDTKVIAIYGSSSPHFTPPLSDKAKVLQTTLDCQPCFARTCRFGHYNCLRFITPEMVCKEITCNC
ncbi:MAG: waaF [Burkholderiales bacterium]|jgi:heptosyltransferase-2|nr:waaF [Burkholderiales bacterium]